MIWKPGDRAILSQQTMNIVGPSDHRGHSCRLLHHIGQHLFKSGDLLDAWEVQCDCDKHLPRVATRVLIPIDDGREVISWSALEDIWTPEGVEV